MKDNFVVPEVVGAECGRGDAEAASRRRKLLSEVSFLPLNGRILELARLLVVPGAIPEKAGPDAAHIAEAAGEECEFLLTWNLRHIANVRIRRGVGEDSCELWLHLNDHLYAGRAIAAEIPT